MHHRWFYKWHADHHVFIEPYGLAGLYCSSVEMVLVNELSIVIPFQLLGFSFIEATIGPMLIALNVLKGHSVLHKRDDIPDYLPYRLIQSWDHDTHHRLMTCNYGIMYLLDRIHGTYVDSK
jgi:methylsterol monooxygenase